MKNIQPNHLITATRARELEQKILASVQHYVNKANTIWGNRFTMPNIQYDLKGMVAGYAYYGQNKVKFNPILLHENETDFLEDTVPHELAHLFSVELYGIMQGRGHGHNWKYVMQRLGVTPKRCHNYDTENARVKEKVKRVIEGHCSICSKTIMLTQKNVNMLWRYTSRCCKAPIKIKPKVDPQQMKAIEIVKRAKEKGHNHNRMVLDIQLDLNVSRDIAIALCNIANDRIMNVS